MSSPYTIKWGILATGGIANTFCRDILCDPATRDVSDVAHEIVAVASSSSAARAEDFIKEVKCTGSPKAYGSYQELVNDPNVDVIYVATPHSHHFQNAMLALEAGKNVLCEKAFTVNAAQAKKLVETAKAKNLFLMEAVWTRYFPLSIKIREMVKSGEIGEVQRVVSDLSFGCVKDDGSYEFEDSHRMLNKNLGGGALLDLGIYALTWVYQILYHCQSEPREAPKVLASMSLYENTGADEMTSMILQFPKTKTVGVALTGLRVATQPDSQGSASGPACRIYGTKGEIQVIGPLFRPTQYRVIKKGGKEGEVEEVSCPIPKDPKREGKDGDKEGWGHGMAWEADEVARCLRDGKKQSETLGWEESITIMETMDEVRRQGGLDYPELIDTDVFDPKSPLNGRRS